MPAVGSPAKQRHPQSSQRGCVCGASPWPGHAQPRRREQHDLRGPTAEARAGKGSREQLDRCTPTRRERWRTKSPKTAVQCVRQRGQGQSARVPKISTSTARCAAAARRSHSPRGRGDRGAPAAPRRQGGACQTTRPYLHLSVAASHRSLHGGGGGDDPTRLAMAARPWLARHRPFPPPPAGGASWGGPHQGRAAAGRPPWRTPRLTRWLVGRQAEAGVPHGGQ